MSHLHTERLAALADQLPTPEEAQHLAACPSCAHERAAHQSLVAMAADERRSIGAPLTDWSSLAPRLRAEGLMSDAAGSAGPVLVTPSPMSARLLRVAAALLLVAGGAFLGRASAAPEQFIAAGGASATAVPPVEALLPDYSTPEEARMALVRYEQAFEHAASYLADFEASRSDDPGADPDTYRTRLAALDRVGRTMREALSESPWDPVINSYYMTAMSQRAATMRQLNQALPAEARLVGF